MTAPAPRGDRAATVVTGTWDYTMSKAPKVLELMGMPTRNSAGIE